jgi:hypothetical protein
MRLLTPRRVAVTALCAALTLGTAGPALAHATHQAAEQRAKAPEDIGDIFGSIDDVLESVLGTVSGKSSTQTLPATGANQQMNDLTAAIEALRKAAAAPKTTTGTVVPADDVFMEPIDSVNSVDGVDGMDAMGSVDTTDADMDKALAAVDKAIDELVAAAVKDQAVTSAPQVQTASKTLTDTIMRDVAKMTGTPATGVNTLPATTLPATSRQAPVTAGR